MENKQKVTPKKRCELRLLEKHWKLRGKPQLTEYIEQNQGGGEIMKVKHKNYVLVQCAFQKMKNRSNYPRFMRQRGLYLQETFLSLKNRCHDTTSFISSVGEMWYM